MSYIPRTIYREQASSSGHLMKVSTGCAILDENIAKSTAASTAIKNHGVTVINTTHPRRLEAPVEGCVKHLIFYGTTKAMKVTTIGATINTASTDDVITVTLTSSTAKWRGAEVTLYGASASQWYMGAASMTFATVKLSSST